MASRKSKKYLVQQELERLEIVEAEREVADEAAEARRPSKVDIFAPERLLKAKVHLRNHRFTAVYRDMNGQKGAGFKVGKGGPRAITDEGNKYLTHARLAREQFLHNIKRAPKHDKLRTWREKERTAHERHLDDIKRRDEPRPGQAGAAVPRGGRLQPLVEASPAPAPAVASRGKRRVGEAKKEEREAKDSILARKVREVRSDYDRGGMAAEWDECRKHFKRLLGGRGGPKEGREGMAKSKMTWQHPKDPSPSPFSSSSVFLRQDARDRPTPWKRTSYAIDQGGGGQQQRNVEFDKSKMKWVDERGHDLDAVIRNRNL